MWVLGHIKAHEASKEGGAKPVGPALTLKAVVKMSPPFDDKTSPDDRHCSNCFMRVLSEEGDAADCTIVKGSISLSKGVCDWWGNGANPSDKSKISKERMNYTESGYAEFPTDFKIQCTTCYYYETINEKTGNCLLWMHRVKGAQCCMKYRNDKESVPQPKPEKESGTDVG